MFCYTCKKQKESSDFHRDKSRKRGFDFRCKDCIKEYNNDRRRKDPERYRLRDREYNLRNKHKRNEYSRIYNQKNKYKIRTHYLVGQALKEGLIVKMSCEICKETNTEAHHDDYGKPLTIRWLCRWHHRLATHK